MSSFHIRPIRTSKLRRIQKPYMARVVSLIANQHRATTPRKTNPAADKTPRSRCRWYNSCTYPHYMHDRTTYHRDHDLIASIHSSPKPPFKDSHNPKHFPSELESFPRLLLLSFTLITSSLTLYVLRYVFQT